MNDARGTAVLELLTLEIIDRIQPSCLALSDAELRLLASDMARLELKYLGHASTTLTERRRITPR